MNVVGETGETKGQGRRRERRTRIPQRSDERFQAEVRRFGSKIIVHQAVLAELAQPIVLDEIVAVRARYAVVEELEERTCHIAEIGAIVEQRAGGPGAIAGFRRDDGFAAAGRTCEGNDGTRIRVSRIVVSEIVVNVRKVEVCADVAELCERSGPCQPRP
jgi:hypothetical protein